MLVKTRSHTGGRPLLSIPRKFAAKLGWDSNTMVEVASSKGAVHPKKIEVHAAEGESGEALKLWEIAGCLHVALPRDFPTGAYYRPQCEEGSMVYSFECKE